MQGALNDNESTLKDLIGAGAGAANVLQSFGIQTQSLLVKTNWIKY